MSTTEKQKCPLSERLRVYYGNVSALVLPSMIIELAERIEALEAKIAPAPAPVSQPAPAEAVDLRAKAEALEQERDQLRDALGGAWAASTHATKQADSLRAELDNARRESREARNHVEQLETAITGLLAELGTAKAEARKQALEEVRNKFWAKWGSAPAGSQLEAAYAEITNLCNNLLNQS
jgi:chromosome segregation ATPase